jgi:hypothetical protein
MRSRREQVLGTRAVSAGCITLSRSASNSSRVAVVGGWCVLWSWDVVGGVEVGVEALVVASELAQVGCRSRGQDRSFADP